MRGSDAGLLDTLRHGEFRALCCAEVISVFGDQLARVALALLVFDRTSSPMLTALTYALTFVPAVLGGWLLSGLADRYPRRRVIILTDCVRAALSAAMAIPGVSLPVLLGLVGSLTLMSAPFKAAQPALLPAVLPAERYQAGLAMRQMIYQVGQVSGFAGGGVLVATITAQGAFLVNASTFLISAVVVMIGVRARPAPRSDQPSGTPEITVPTPSWRTLAAPFSLVCMVGLYVVPEGLAAPYAHALGATAAGVGFLLAADPVGSVLGAWWAAKTTSKGPPTRPSITLPAAAAGMPLAACIVAPGMLGSIALWAVSGALTTLYMIRMQAVVVAIVPDSRRGTVLGRLNTISYTSQGVAIVAGGVLAERIGPAGAVATSGALGTMLAVAIAFMWREVRPRPAAENAKWARLTLRLLPIDAKSLGLDRRRYRRTAKGIGEHPPGTQSNLEFGIEKDRMLARRLRRRD